MYKSQTRGREIYASLGGRVGIITIIVIAIVLTIAIVLFVRRRMMKQREDDDDFLRYQRLIKAYLRTKRENQKFTEHSVQLEMDRFQFSKTLIPLGDEDQGINWHTDSSVFGDMCTILMAMVSHASDKSSKFYRNELLWRQIMFAVRTIANNMPNKTENHSTPWGTNWYQFSITYPTFLVSVAFSYYETFGEEEPFLTRHLSSYINNYFKESAIPNGMISMGWLRTESNVIGMSVPVIGGRLYSKRFDPNANSQKYARQYMSAEYVYSGNGFYYDNTYITHVSRNDGYTTSFYHEFILVFQFYRMNTRFFDVLHRHFGITEHPDFPLHHGPWFNRGPMMKGFEPGRKFAHYGLDIRGFERSVCLRTKEVSLHFSGQILPLAAYEADRTNQEWAQCWVFMRRPITKDSASRLYTSLVPFYDGVHSYGKKQIDWPSGLATTQTFEPRNALCSLAYIQGRAAGMYNKYDIRMADEFTFDIEEFNLTTPTGFHVIFRCTVDTVAAAANPYTIACRLGKLEANQAKERLTGVNAKHAYAFDDFIGTFLYLDEVDEENAEAVVHLDEIIDPDTNEPINALYVQPTPRKVFHFGFSNNFYAYGTEKRHNNLVAFPNMHELVTDDFKLERLDTDNALLFLHYYREKISVVTYAFNHVLPRGITIKKDLLDQKFTRYKVVDGIFNSETSEYTVNTYEKQFQMVLINVEYK